MLGYTEYDGRDYMVRQMKNLKASIPVEFLTGASFNFYAWACGAILARAHARTGDPARIAGYCGNSTDLDDALADWAESYGDQTEQDHATLVESIKSGKTKAHIEGTDES
jgi:sugar/nucleoside kinase (ribokinase family)